jgi:hypothetical protein
LSRRFDPTRASLVFLGSFDRCHVLALMGVTEILPSGPRVGVRFESPTKIRRRHNNALLGIEIHAHLNGFAAFKPCGFAMGSPQRNAWRPPIAATVLRYVYPFNVTFTGARIRPNTGFGSKGSGIKHIDPSRTILVLTVFDAIRRSSPDMTRLKHFHR